MKLQECLQDTVNKRAANLFNKKSNIYSLTSHGNKVFQHKLETKSDNKKEEKKMGETMTKQEHFDDMP